MTYAKRILITYLGLIVTFGLFWWLRVWSSSEITESLYYGLVLGLASGSLSIIIIVAYDYVLRWPILRKYGCRSFELIQSRELYIEGSIDDAREKSIDALKRLKGIIHVDIDRENNKITAIRKANLKTPGEKLVIRLNEINGKVKVFIQSRPRIKGAIIDGGNGIENVEFILQCLRE